MKDLMTCPEMPDEIWVYTEKGSNFLHACYLPFSGNDFGRLTEPVKYTRASTPTPDLGVAVKALRAVMDWFDGEIFDDDDRTGGCTQEERAENISDTIRVALKSLGGE